ncbi:TatD family hydrolase [Patescibacteria group bacterium]|nr:TatD family hydrolase [Patescibacteria group bacterium]
MSYPKAQALRDTCLITPIEKILLETDAPYLAPQDLRGTTNTPTNVKFVYEFVAQLKNISLDALTEQMEKNFMKFYE